MNLINLLGFLIMCYGIVAFILSFIPIQRSRAGRAVGEPLPIKLPLKVPAIVIGATLWVLTMLIVKVGGQDVGVLITPNGVSENELHTGWHVVAPWNDVYPMEKTVWVYTCAHASKEGAKANADEIWAPTNQGVKMGFDVSVSWHILPDEANWIYTNVSEADGEDNARYIWLQENVIRPKLKSAMALVVLNYSPTECYSTKRQSIQDEVFKKMTRDVKGYKLIIDQVDMREVFYNKAFETALNNTKLAEQEVLRQIQITKQKDEMLTQARINKDIAIEQAKGEAEALKIKGTSIAQNPKIIELEWINKWSGELPTYMMGSGQGIMLNLK